MNILITSVSNKVSLVKAFQAGLKKENIYGSVIGIDIDPVSAGLYFCSKHFISPRLSDSKYLEWIEHLCRKEKIDLIIPTRDADVRYLSRNKDYLENQLGLKIMAPNIETVEICEDKFLFSRYLIEHGFNTIPTWDVYNDNIPFPCLIKERRGASAKNITVANNKNELIDALGKVEESVIQEYIIGEEYTIDYFADFTGKALFALPRKRIKVSEGESKVGLTVKDKALSKACTLLGTSLKLIGHNVIQCFKRKNGEILFIEINPRFGGGSNLCFAAGLPSPQYIIQLINGKKVSIPEYKCNYTMIRYSEDFFIEQDRITPV